MNYSSKISLILKKNRKNKIKIINLIILYSILFTFLYIMILIINSLNSTMYKSVSLNLNDFSITYIIPSGNVGYDLYENTLNEVSNLNIVNIKGYTYTNEEAYDFSYIPYEIITSLDYDNLKPMVYLSQDYMIQYKIGDTYKTSLGDFFVLGFLNTNETKVVLDLNYLIKNQKTNVRGFYINLHYDNVDKKELNYILDIYKDLKDNDVFFSEYDLDIIIDTKTKTNIYMIIGYIFVIFISVILLSTLYNTFSINVEEDRYFYFMLRICGVNKKEIISFNLWENLIITLISFLISIAIFFTMYNALKKFFTRFVTLLFKQTIDEFYYDICVSFNPKFYIFIIPIVLSVLISIINIIFKRKKNSILKDSYIGELYEE